MIKISRTKQGCPTLLAYPGFGYPSTDGRWRIHVAGIVWQEPVVFSRHQRWLIKMLGGVMKASAEDLAGETFQDRITPFMAEAEHRQSILVEIAGSIQKLRKKTRKNGHFQSFLTIDEHYLERSAHTDSFGNRVVPFSVTVDDPKASPVAGLIYLLDRHGTSIVSDIDDTIKDSLVSDRKELLANTFLRDFRSVEGMADVYKVWSDLGAKFHYVSSSPWQLFESLYAMNMSHQFPTGTMHLRNFRLRDQLLKKVIIRRPGKMTAIRFLMKHLPHRQFVLIGDSGEKDPEIYAKVSRKFPGRVKGLLIRELEQRPLDPEREQKLRDSLDAGLFAKFRSAEELAALTGGLFEN